MLNIDIRLQTRRHSEAQIAVLAIKPHVGWDEKACRESYQIERERMDVERSRMRESEGTTTCFQTFFCASIPSILLAKVGYGYCSTHTHTSIYIYIYIFDFRKKGKLFFESIYIYILQRIKTEKEEEE